MEKPFIPTIGIITAGVLLILASTATAQRKKESHILGKVLEKITRLDGTVLYQPVQRMKLSLKSSPEDAVFSNDEGFFDLRIPFVKKESIIKLYIEKENYKILADQNSVSTLPFLTLTQRPQEDIRLDVYVTKTANSLQSATNTSFKSIGLSGYIQKGEDVLEGVEVKVKGVESVHDNTNPDGFFEIYLPQNKFDAANSFTLILSKDDQFQEILFEDFEQFSRAESIAFSSYEPPKAEVEETNPKDSLDALVLSDLESREDLDGVQIENNFRNFISSLDSLDFKNLSTDKIQVLKDSLNKYADYLTNLREELTGLKSRGTIDTLLRVEKTLAEKQKQLAEKERELFEAELANKTKTIIILSLIIVLIVFSSLSYYYFYINKKIQSQSSELNRRNQFIEFLLRELNHRVTNNLQVISSLVKRKIRRMPDENAKNALKEINNRVLDIATVHVGLYSKNDARLTKLGDYLTKITQVLEKLYGFNDKPLKIEVNAPEIEIAHKDAVYFGLIINELVTNSLKYAFEGITQPKLTIDIRKLKEKTFAITVEDNGRGIPETFNLAEAKSSGLKLVNLITQMLGGTFEMSSQEGTKFELTLKVS